MRQPRRGDLVVLEDQGFDKGRFDENVNDLLSASIFQVVVTQVKSVWLVVSENFPQETDIVDVLVSEGELGSCDVEEGVYIVLGDLLVLL